MATQFIPFDFLTPKSNILTYQSSFFENT
jgi:hypothetical protein